MKIYLVEDCANAPGRILACFIHEWQATKFANDQPDAVAVETRTLFYGPPPNAIGYNT